MKQGTSNFISIYIGIFTGVIAIISALAMFFPIERERPKKFARFIGVILLFFICLPALYNLITNQFSQPSIDSSFLGTNIYFGQSTNNLPDGNGRLFDKDKKIIYDGEFKQGKYDGKGTLFASYQDSGISKTYTQYEGSWRNGKFDGEGEYYALYKGEPVLTYEGEYLCNQRNGHGEAYEYDYDGGEIYKKSKYIGAFAYHEKNGYGIYTEYDVLGNPVRRYRGTWWSDEFWGVGILEYIDANYGKVIFHGYFAGGKPTAGVLYDIGKWNSPIKQGVIDDNGEYDDSDLIEKYPYPDSKDSLWG